MIIGGLQQTSLIDFPEKISAIIFTQGCNFRCSYCHNPELLKAQNTDYSFEKIMEFLKKRIGKLDGVVITGGEATLQNDLPECISKIRELGFEIKLDTNGTNPEMLQNLINQGLVDYIAMDIKAPLDKYFDITGLNFNTEKIMQSINIIKSSGVEYEFRTTVLKKFLDKSDFEKIGDLLDGTKKYYLQKFVSAKILDGTLIDEKNYTDEEFEEIAENLRQKIKIVGVR